MGKRYMVVMTNGDTYSLYEIDFERVRAAMRNKDVIIDVMDKTKKLKLTLQVENISSAVEQEVENA